LQKVAVPITEDDSCLLYGVTFRRHLLLKRAILARLARCGVGVRRALPRDIAGYEAAGPEGYVAYESDKQGHEIECEEVDLGSREEAIEALGELDCAVHGTDLGAMDRVSDVRTGAEMETHKDADAADEHGGGEGAPVVVPLQVAVPNPRLGFVLVHAVEEAQIDTREEGK
jgi:hypothetical protein